MEWPVKSSFDVYYHIYSSAIAFQVANVDLGRLKTITVRHDNKGGKESWFVDQVRQKISIEEFFKYLSNIHVS